MSNLNLPSSIPISVRVWLATDEYDHNDDPNTISVTSIIKPVKQILLGIRAELQTAKDVAAGKDTPLSNVNTMVSSKIGTAIHNNIEAAWLGDLKVPMAALGIPTAIAKRIKVNPSDADLAADPDTIPVYMELRSDRVVDGITISGKFDFLIEGRIEDFKSTSTFTYMHKSNDEKWGLQGSIYKWLNIKKVTQDVMAIQYIFTDWSQGKVSQDPHYPRSKTVEYLIPLMSEAETQKYLEDKISELKRLYNAKEEAMPLCTPVDLWQKESVFKYYKNPQKMTRSTKNFPSAAEANERLAQDNFVGIVVEKKGSKGFCVYCSASPICKQKDEYILDGTLVL